ncbi:replication endonuclease [Aeromonas veronii]|uniref:Replication endonuclease n=2 Tax=Aeromonas veronii TaxID=654 RepID=A0A3A9IST1_AERVE|nr:replication endonuclease [Aeromonas veronii]RKJ89944.1 replication endonuclease [Aeromonas veronii]
MRDYHAELFDAKPVQPRQPSPWKLAASVKAMAKAIMNTRRVTLCCLADSRLPPARRAPSALDLDSQIAAIRSYFSEIQGAYALDWALDLLTRPIPRANGGPGIQLPKDLRAELFVGYCRRRAPDALKGIAITKDANRWLSSRINTLRQVQNVIPEPLEQLRTKESRERLAVNYVERVVRLRDAATDSGKQLVPPLHLWNMCKQPVDAWGMLPRLPKFRTTEGRDSFIVSRLIRWLDPKWWERRLRKRWDQYNEHCAILLGKVRKGVSAYVSSQGLQAFVERQRMAAAWLKDMEAYNAQDNIVISLEEAVKASVANPTNRRHELVVRARGFSDVADEMGYVGLFFTWTAPSRFHPWKTVKASQPGKADTTTENPKHDGSSPNDAQRYIGKLWERCRSALDRNVSMAPGLPVPSKPLRCKGVRAIQPHIDGPAKWRLGGGWDKFRQHLANTPRPYDDPIDYFGFRVVEPHHDGTPHWHLLIWVKPEHKHRLIGILQRYALSHDKGDLERKRHPESKCPYSDINPRFNWKEMDKEKGGAVGYIVKYIAKNIDGHRVGDQGDLEAETAATEGARRVRAWASLWGLRQFQPLKGPPVGIWRELRKLPGRLQEAKGVVVAPLASPIMEECRRYADAVDWKNFTQAMGGPCCRRDERPLSIHRTAFAEPNQYGEPTTKLVGVRAADGHIQQTRSGEWVLRKCGSQSTTTPKDGGFWGVGERSELKVCERSEALPPLGALATTVRDDLRGSKKDPFSGMNLFHLGLDTEDVAMIQRGLIVKAGDRYVCIRNGDLKVSEQHPYSSPDELSPYQAGLEATGRAERRAASLDEIRGMLAQSGDPAAWLAAMTATGADDALALLDALEEEDAEQASAQLERLRDTVDLQAWPQPPEEHRQEAISNAEFFGGSDGWRLPTGGQDIHRTIVEATKASLTGIRPDHREALVTHLMDRADAVTPNGGDIVAFVADRLMPLPPGIQQPEKTV